jgi:hypothetical protein
MMSTLDLNCQYDTVWMERNKSCCAGQTSIVYLYMFIITDRVRKEVFLRPLLFREEQKCRVKKL